MNKGLFAKLADEYNKMTPTGKGMIILCIILIIGIIIRWDATIEGIQRGFGFFSNR